MSVINISVVVPAFNAAKTIAQTIQAVVNQNYSGQFEIIIVDDGSIDHTSEIVKDYESDPRVRYVLQENAGPSVARNRGAKIAQYEKICFTDSDCVPRRDWLENISFPFSISGVAVVAGSYGIANEDNVLANCVYREILYRHHHLMPQYPRVFGSYNFCIDKNVFESMGGFNEDYSYPSGEDNDLSYRIIAAGHKIYFEKNACVDHYHPESLAKYLQEQFCHGFWRVKMYLDYPQMSGGDDYTFWKDIVEVPLSLLGVAFFVAGIFFKSIFFIFSCLGSCFVLAVLQWSFGFLMLIESNDVFFWGNIMFVRAFARTFGFVGGFFYFLKEKFKKALTH